MNSQVNVFDYRTLDSLLPYLMLMNIKILLKYVYFSCLKFYHNRTFMSPIPGILKEPSSNNEYPYSSYNT